MIVSPCKRGTSASWFLELLSTHIPIDTEPVCHADRVAHFEGITLLSAARSVQLRSSKAVSAGNSRTRLATSLDARSPSSPSCAA